MCSLLCAVGPLNTTNVKVGFLFIDASTAVQLQQHAGCCQLTD